MRSGGPLGDLYPEGEPLPFSALLEDKSPSIPVPRNTLLVLGASSVGDGKKESWEEGTKLVREIWDSSDDLLARSIAGLWPRHKSFEILSQATQQRPGEERLDSGHSHLRPQTKPPIGVNELEEVHVFYTLKDKEHADPKGEA